MGKNRLPLRVSPGPRRNGSGSRRRAFLIATEVGLSLILLIGAGLMIKSFANLTKVAPGFNPDRLLIFNIGASARADENAQLQFYQQVVQRVAGPQ